MLIAILVPAGPLELDHSRSEAMYHLETPLLTHLAFVFNWLGRGLGRAIALAAAHTTDLATGAPTHGA